MREDLGLPAFELTLFDQKWTPQALLVTSFPYMESCQNFYEQYSCIHFLAEILLEKQFKLLVWTKDGAVSAENANIFIDLVVNQLQIPAKEDLEKLNFPFPYQIMNESHWREFLIEYSQILLTSLDEASELNYSAAVILETKLTAQLIESTNIRHLTQKDEDAKNPSPFTENYLKQESKEFQQLKELKEYCEFINLSQGKILCTNISEFFISKGQNQLLISDSSLTQADLDKILNFPQALSYSAIWVITFKNCLFMEKLNFKKLTPNFKTIELHDCKNFLPDFGSFPCRKYHIHIANSIFNNHAREIDNLINHTPLNFYLTLTEECLKIKRNSLIQSLTINSSNSRNSKKIILEKPVLLYSKIPLDIIYLLKLKELDSEKSELIMKLEIETLFRILTNYTTKIQQLELVLDKGSTAYQERLLVIISQCQQEIPCSFPIRLYCAKSAIFNFVDALSITTYIDISEL